MKSVRKGDRVILIKANSSPSSEIPLWGSKYGCVGTATKSASKSSHGVKINWDNGKSTTFYIYKLELYDEQSASKDPNLAFLYRKMGR